MAHIIVVGNEKGGSGKSTTTMHLATALARMGHRVGGLDLDLRQKTFGQYVTNRLRYAAEKEITLQSPNYIEFPEIANADLNPSENLMDRRLSAAVEVLEPQSDFIVIDCPGSHTRLSQMAHAMADTLITPLNDSFIDFDLLAKIKSDGITVQGPSVYSEMVWSELNGAGLLTQTALSELTQERLQDLLSKAAKAAAINCGREGCDPPSSVELL